MSYSWVMLLLQWLLAFMALMALVKANEEDQSGLQTAENRYIVIKPTRDSGGNPPHVLRLLQSLVGNRNILRRNDNPKRDRPVFYTTRFGKRSQLPSVRLYPDDLLNNNPLLNKMLNKGLQSDSETEESRRGELLCTPDGQNCFPIISGLIVAIVILNNYHLVF